MRESTADGFRDCEADERTSVRMGPAVEADDRQDSLMMAFGERSVSSEGQYQRIARMHIVISPV